MTSVPDLTAAVWRKSSYSNGDGGACLEVADAPGVNPVRDSKLRDGPVLLVPDRAWGSFVEAVKAGSISRN
ncbi:DUF397 domain-containing protein [Streptomyces sp. NBC_00385]|uniref:DUF397 domain-containing protein n=1 Tax=Streptomyces sp. NBC_00385 TaxID=2975733 RepID=UPI002DD8469A|nr:DUF397 domain-containing protein [Streptomyces sp. NBC_00385]WRZ06040.1 DUF397 domain-containing protein [Streptomyces sp. NBC_00385]